MQTPSAMLLQGTLAISHILLHACIQIENKIEIGLTQDLWVTLHLDITWKRGNLEVMCKQRLTIFMISSFRIEADLGVFFIISLVCRSFSFFAQRCPETILQTSIGKKQPLSGLPTCKQGR